MEGTLRVTSEPQGDASCKGVKAGGIWGVRVHSLVEITKVVKKLLGGKALGVDIGCSTLGLENWGCCPYFLKKCVRRCVPTTGVLH